MDLATTPEVLGERGLLRDGTLVLAATNPSDGVAATTISVLARCGLAPSGISTIPCETGASVRELTTTLTARPEGLVLTASGETLVALTAGQVHAIRVDAPDASLAGAASVDAPALRSEAVAANVDHLVGALASGDVVIVRRGETLLAVDVSPGAILTNDPATRTWTLGEDAGALRVLAFGHRTLLAREIRRDGADRLHLLRVDPSHRHDHGGVASRGAAIELAEGHFDHVIVVPGPSPASLGEAFDARPDIPIDAWVVASSREDGGYVSIFRVVDGALVDRFPGQLAPGLMPFASAEGISAVSPDASAIAYLTPAGNVAVRALGEADVCLAQPAVGGAFTLAGFASDGALWSQLDRDDGRGRVYVHDLAHRILRAVTPADEPHVLRGVPFVAAASLGDDTPSHLAITTRDGALSAATPDHAAIPLLAAAATTSVLARAEPKPWVLVGGDDLRLQRLHSDDDTVALGQAPLVHTQGGALAPFVRSLSARTCIASTHTTGWASTCTDTTPTIVPAMPRAELGDEP